MSPGCSVAGYPGEFFTSKLAGQIAEVQESSLKLGLVHRANDSIARTVPFFPDPSLVPVSTRIGTSQDSDRKSPVDVWVGFAHVIRLDRGKARCPRP